jgi:hypothetical protein
MRLDLWESAGLDSAGNYTMSMAHGEFIFTPASQNACFVLVPLGSGIKVFSGMNTFEEIPPCQILNMYLLTRGLDYIFTRAGLVVAHLGAHATGWEISEDSNSPK